jgi:Cdc6-like AAA superfamily ATPase
MGMFERTASVFDDAMVLDEEYQPDEIRERDEELEQYRQALQPIIDNRPLSNIFVYGKTGTGKTYAKSYMLEHLRDDAERYDDGEPEQFVFDARPSDAIALAVRVECPITVSDEILDAAGRAPEEVDIGRVDDGPVSDPFSDERGE